MEQAEKYLATFVENAGKYLTDDMSLERMWPLLKSVDNPQNNLSVVHVAGTSGKTSTCYYIADYLRSSGASVGLTVSPHIQTVRERIQVNGEPLSEEEFVAYFDEFCQLVDVSNEPSFYELLMTFVFWVFVKVGVDYAVLETGMGGLFDSTNVVVREDKICVITDIGYDHMNVLGDTLEQIASQKAGIIHDKNSVFMYEQGTSVMQAIRCRVSQYNAHLEIVSDTNESVSMPKFQRRNWHLARNVVEHIAKRDTLLLAESYHPESVVVPGRMEIYEMSDGVTIVLDGAHNEQKITAFVESFVERFPGQKAAVMLGVKEGKEYQKVIDDLAEITQSMVTTTFTTSQDIPSSAHNPYELASYAHETHAISTTVEKDIEQAFQLLLQHPCKLKVVVGSFYLLGEIRTLLFK